MRDYLLEHIYKTSEPDESFIDWVLQYVVRYPSPFSMEESDDRKSELVYGAYQSLHSVGNPYLDHWNSSRADLVAEFVDTPPSPLSIEPVELAITPEGMDVSYWLCTQVLLLGTIQLVELTNLPATFHRDPVRALLPLLKASLPILKDLHVKHEGIQSYHRARYLLLRYYLDIEYAELTN